MRALKFLPLAGLVLGILAMARPASGFGGFFVSTKDAPIFVESAHVVVVREGTRTVLVLAPTYAGPADPFAVVVPLSSPPLSVRVVPRSIVDHLIELDAPRLEEVWEEDPCADAGSVPRTPVRPPRIRPSDAHVAPKVEARALGEEYDLTVVTPKDAAELATWLRRRGYVVPASLEERLPATVTPGATVLVLRPVAGKAHEERVAGPIARHVRLPPVRIELEQQRLVLPIRPALAQAAGALDLVVHTLARYQRYEVVGSETVLAATGVEVVDAARYRLGSLVSSLTDRALARRPGSAVTEYVGDAMACEGCASRGLRADDLLALGADALPGAAQDRRNALFGTGFVLTRMHLRLGRDRAPEDLALAPSSAPLRTPNGSFASRYVLRHPFAGGIACADPDRGVYRADPARARPMAATAVGTSLDDAELAALLAVDLPDLGVVAPPTVEMGAPDAEAPAENPPPAPATAVTAGCGCRAAGGEAPSAGGVVVMLLLAAWLRRLRCR